MIREKMTEVESQKGVCHAAYAKKFRDRSATKNLSHDFCLLRAEGGFSLISAIFLLVVIAALGTFAVTLSTTQQQSAALDVQGARAYQAARAGIEWGAFQVLRNTNCPVAPTTLPALPNTLASFTVTVLCTSTATTEAGLPVTMFQLTSTAIQGTPATPNYVDRQMSVTIAQ
jgi:MSHA biogenesis protein MshP